MKERRAEINYIFSSENLIKAEQTSSLLLVDVEFGKESKKTETPLVLSKCRDYQ